MVPHWDRGVFTMKRRIIVSAILFHLFVACVKETEQFTIPFAAVSFEVHRGSYDVELRNPMAYKIFTSSNRRLASDRFGYAGLLVVSDVTGETLFAYDLCCPYEDSRDIKVTPSNEGTAVCLNCGSLFVTRYGQGSVVSGPAKQPLQRYQVVPLYQDVYRIRN